MYSAALRQLQTGCFSRNLLIQSFYILFPDADALRLALATNSTTTPVTPESLESVSPLSRGVYAISACECLLNVRISLFPRLFFRPFKFYTIFTEEICSCYHNVNDSNSVPNHGIAATLAYVNRELTNTLVFIMSPRGLYGREREHAMRYYSGCFGQRFFAIPSALGRTCLLG